MDERLEERDDKPWVVRGVAEKTRRQVKAYAAQSGATMAEALETFVRAGLEMGQVYQQLDDDGHALQTISQALEAFRAQLHDPRRLSNPLQRDPQEFEWAYDAMMHQLQIILSQHDRLRSRLPYVRPWVWRDE